MKLERSILAFEAVLLTGLAPNAKASCLGPDTDCFSGAPFAAEFVKAIELRECHDTGFSENDEASPPAASSSPLAEFARSHGESALPLYAAILERCSERGLGELTRIAGYEALAALDTVAARRLVDKALAAERRPGQMIPPQTALSFHAWAIVRMQGGTKRIADALPAEAASSARAALAYSLRRGDTDIAAAALREPAAHDPSPDVRAAAQESLWLLEHPGLCRLCRQGYTIRRKGLSVRCLYSCREGWFTEKHFLFCPGSAVPPWLKGH